MAPHIIKYSNTKCVLGNELYQSTVWVHLLLIDTFQFFIILNEMFKYSAHIYWFF